MLSKQFLLNKDGSYPNEITEFDVLRLGLIPVIPTDIPSDVDENSKIIEVDPVKIEGVYYQQWQVVPKESSN